MHVMKVAPAFTAYGLPPIRSVRVSTTHCLLYAIGTT
jgi:hypothetical protein